MASHSPPILFWAHRDRPSFQMRGHQIARALSDRGHDVAVRFGPARRTLADVRDSIVVCVKSRPWLAGLRRRGNRVVFDALDFQDALGLPRVADAVICGSRDMQRRLEGRVKRELALWTIYHHADPELGPHCAGVADLRLAYMGEQDNSRFLDGEIPELHMVSFTEEGWRERIRRFNAHFSARLDRNKSVIKLANAATLEAVYLTGPEPGCVELLGDDYPFFLRSYRDLSAVREDVARLRDAIGSRLWHDAVERLRAAREQLTLEASVRQYEALLRSLG